MTDDEYLHWVGKRVTGAFFPPFGGKTFFNRDLFDYVLAAWNSNVEVINREMEDINERWSEPGQSVKLRVDSAHRTIKLKIYTPTHCLKATISTDGVEFREMDRSE